MTPETRGAGDADARFGAWVSLLNRAAHVYFSKVLKPYHLGPGQQAYLMVIQPREEVSQGQIARRLKIDKANVARAVKSLSDVGYVERARPAEDRRRWTVRLTSKGVEVREAVESLMQNWVAAIRSDVPQADWEEFVGTLEPVALRAMEFAAGARLPG